MAPFGPGGGHASAALRLLSDIPVSQRRRALHLHGRRSGILTPYLLWAVLGGVENFVPKLVLRCHPPNNSQTASAPGTPIASPLIRKELPRG